MARQYGNTRVTAGRTLIRRYVLAPSQTGTGDEAAVRAASIPPLGGGPDIHGAAAHALTITEPAGTGSCCTATPIKNCRIGAKNCNSPTIDSGSRLAAAAKQISGTTVTGPASINSVLLPAPWWPIASVPCP